MHVQVKLFSILRQYVKDYDPEKGLALEMAENARVSDLIDALGLPEGCAPVVTAAGLVLKKDDPVGGHRAFMIFQPVAGG